MSKGSDLENTSLSWLDTLDGVADGTVKGQNKLLAAATESMMGDLRTAYSKYTQSGGKTNAYQAGQLAARIENTLQLLPPKARQRLEGMYQADLAKAQEVGRKAGVELDKINDQKKNKTLNANAKPNTDAMKAAGRRLGTFWGDENSKLTDRVKALTRQAALEGKSWRQLSLQIRELLSVDKTQNAQSLAKTKRMGLAQRAELIARTEMGFAFIEGQKDNFKKNGYEYVRWSAAGERTCGYCISRDGLVYQVDEIDGAIPAHPRCRCSLIPVDAPSLKKGKGGPTGPEAADELDDSYWSKSRKAKMDRWKQDQNLNGKGEPKQILKSNSELDQALRDFSQTPTNTERWFRPNAGAAKPAWMPSGNIIPDMTAAAKNAQDAADKPRRDADEAERKRKQDEADQAERDADIAQRKKAQDALDEKEFTAVSKAFGDKGSIDPTKFRKLPKGDRDRLVKAANDKLAAEAAAKAKAKAAEKTPQAILDAGLEPGWKIAADNPTFRAKMLDAAEKLVAKQKAVRDADARADKQARALQGKIAGKKRLEDRTADKVITPKTGQIKAQDFGDAMKLLTGQGGLVGLNTQRFMKFQERYNISTITGTGGESRIEHLLGSRQLRSSLKAAQARKTATNRFGGGNDKVFREILKELDDYGKPGAITPGWAKKHMTVDKRDGVGGSTADGMGAVKVKTAKYHRKVDAKGLKTLQDAVEDSVLKAAQNNPYELTSSKAATLTINRTKYRFNVAEGEWLTTYIHEMGHQLHYAVGAPMPPIGAARNWKPSKYGITNKHEWFAETFTQYTLAPKALKRYAPDAYDFIDQQVKRALTGKPGEVGKAKQLGEEPPRAFIREDLVKKAKTKQKPIDGTVKELKAMAKEAGLTGYSKLTKPQLIEALSKTGSAGKAPTQAETDFQAAKAKLKAKKAAQAAADKASLTKAKGPSGKQQIKDIQATKAQEVAAKAKAKEELIKSLKPGDDVTFAAAGNYGKGTVTKKANLKDPKLPIEIRANADGPYWKKGDIIPANKNKGLIAKGDLPEAKTDMGQLTAAQKASKAKWDELVAKANGKGPLKTGSAGTQAPAKTESSPVSTGTKPKAVPPKTAPAKAKDLGKQTVKQLQAEAKAQGLKGYSKLKKPDLIKALEEKAAPKAAGIKKKAAPKKNLTQAEKDFNLVKEQVLPNLTKEQWASKSDAAKTLTLKTAAKKAAAPKLTAAELKAKEAKAKYEAALEAKAQKKIAADIAKLDAEVAQKAAKAAAKSANKAVEDEIAAINKEIKAISQKALTGQKVTEAEKKRAADLQKKKRELMQEEPGDAITKIDPTTTDIEHIYRAKDFKAYGYKSRAEMTEALQTVAEYTDDGYKQFMNAQWAAKLQAGGKLTAYEKARAQEAISTKNALKLQRDIEAAERLEEFIAKAPKYDGLVMRGLHMADDASALAFIKNLGKGTKTNSVESWSDDYATAEQFSNGRKGMVGIVLSVQNKNGAPIAGASNFSTESEVLVPSGQRYRVKNVTKRIDDDLEIGGNKQVIYDVDLELID